jgi:hypothetical protein
LAGSMIEDSPHSFQVLTKIPSGRAASAFS